MLRAVVNGLLTSNFQFIEAIPHRNDAGPIIGYALGVAVYGPLVLLGVARGSRADRISLGCVVLICALTVITVTLMTYRSSGQLWQGRYLFPLGIGAFLLAGNALDRPAVRADHAVASTRLALGALAVLAVSNAIFAAAVLDRLSRSSPQAGSDSWWRLPLPVVLGLGVLSLVLRGGAVAADHRWWIQERPRLPPSRDHTRRGELRT